MKKFTNPKLLISAVTEKNNEFHILIIRHINEVFNMVIFESISLENLFFTKLLQRIIL